MFRRRFLSRQVGLKFTDESSSKLNASQAGIVYGNSPTGFGAVDISYATGEAFANIYLYDVSTNSQLSDETVTNAVVYICIHYNSSLYLVYPLNNDVAILPINNLADYASNYSYQWIYDGTYKGFRLLNYQNQSISLSLTSDNELQIIQTTSSKVLVRNGAKLALKSSTSELWYLYCINYYNEMYTTANNTYAAYLYSFSYTTRGLFRITYDYTLTRKTSATISNNEDTMLVVNDSSGNYFIVGRMNDYTYFFQITPNISGTQLTFSTRNDTSYMNDYTLVTTKNGDAVYLQSKSSSSYYLAPPSTIAEGQYLRYLTTSSAFFYNDTNGLCVSKDNFATSPFGVSSISTQLVATQDASSAGTTILFRKDGSTWSPYYGSLNTGETYAIVVRKAPDDDEPNPNYYLVGAEGDKLTSHTFSALNDIDIGSDSEFVATAGTWGCGLTSGSYGLNVNNNNMALLAVSLDWVYTGDSTTPENSRLWSATTQTVNYYPEYRNSDLEADTQATDMTCDIFLVQNGKVQIQADEFVDGCTYVLVFVDNGNHYAACVNGTDIVPVLYANALPKNLPSEYHFAAEESGQGFILKNNNQAMGVATSTKLALGYNAVWTYTGGTTE